MGLGVKPDVVLPPPPERGPPSWMATRPGGIRAFLRDFKTYDPDRNRFLAFERPVFVVVGGLSNPDDYGEVAERLSSVFPDFRLEMSPDRHHVNPPHRIEPDQLAGLLREHWERADRVVQGD